MKISGLFSMSLGLWILLLGFESCQCYDIKSLKQRFIKRFNDSCLKYDFVKYYLDGLQNPSDKQVVFVFNEKGFRNGGLGDRLGGLVTAMGMALRFNRTLLIQSDLDIHHFYRPFAPDIFERQDQVPFEDRMRHQKYSWKSDVPQFDSIESLWNSYDYRYSYGNWSSISRYDRKNADNDNTEYDIYYCINHGASLTGSCGLDKGNVAQPIIKLRSNRAYLCHWNNPGSVSYDELHTLVGNKDQHIDLFEIGGCFLRLAMWPTDILWHHIHQALHYHHQSQMYHHKPVTNWNRILSMHFRCGDTSYRNPNKAATYCRHDPHLHLQAAEESTHMSLGTPISLGECAVDVLKSQRESLRAPVVVSDKTTNQGLEGTTTTTTTTTATAVAANRPPSDAANVDQEQVKDIITVTDTATDTDTDTATVKTDAREEEDGVSLSSVWNENRRSLSTTTTDTTATATTPGSQEDSLIYIMADSMASTLQMQETVVNAMNQQLGSGGSGSLEVMISPNGCHIEMSHTLECFQTTVVYWMIMTLSDHIVTQTERKGPISGFSRFAAMYGLASNSLHNGKDCHDSMTTYDLGHQLQGNWFC